MCTLAGLGVDEQCDRLKPYNLKRPLFIVFPYFEFFFILTVDSLINKDYFKLHIIGNKKAY